MSESNMNYTAQRMAFVLLVTGTVAGCYTAESEKQRYIQGVKEKCEAQGKQFVLGDVRQEGIPHLTRFSTSVTGYCVEDCAKEGKQTYILQEQRPGVPIRLLCIQPSQLVRIPSPFGVETLASASIKGARILKVESGSIAATAGFKFNDIIYDFGGQPVATANDLQAAVASAPAGRQVLIRFLRDEQEASATAQF
jgi:membrane-associated protease RseP (regulator of RpoE activity)